MRHTLILPAALLLVSVISALAPAIVDADSIAAQMVEGTETSTWGYKPLNAAIPVGQTLTWTNVGQAPHTATDDQGTWDTGIVAPGANFSLTFATPGTYNYHCTLHIWMKGTLVVSDATASDSPAADDSP